MNQIKIGKFIKERRVLKKLTQEQLAEKLNITDRAVSKWENGKCMPDASLMVELCDILSISVNELLNGEIIDNKDYIKKYDELLIELKREEEDKNKKLIFSMWTILISSILFFILNIVLIINYVDEKSINLWMSLSVIIFFISSVLAIKVEYDAGYYECKNCKYKFIPRFIDVFFSSHITTTRKPKCPNCNKKVWAKKVMTK